MTRSEFLQWVDENCLKGIQKEDFIEPLAVGSINLIEYAHKEKNQPINELVELFRPLVIQSH